MNVSQTNGLWTLQSFLLSLLIHSTLEDGTFTFFFKMISAI